MDGHILGTKRKGKNDEIISVLLTIFGDLIMACGKCGCGSTKSKPKVKAKKKAKKKK